jgi:hypothetical protein
MNGRTTIDEVLNPCSAVMDRQTYGIRALNWTTYGHRLIRVGSFGCYLDLFWVGRWYWPTVSRMRSARILFFPGGSFMWPAHDLLSIKED